MFNDWAKFTNEAQKFLLGMAELLTNRYICLASAISGIRIVCCLASDSSLSSRMVYSTSINWQIYYD
jgi:hypothetical protein